MISIIITAFKEPICVAKAIKSIVRPFYSGIPDDFELIQISPDEETLRSGAEAASGEKWCRGKYFQIKDPAKGKPFALNLGFKKARGEILILTDGDVYFDKGAISHLLSAFHDPKVGGVSGRPISNDPKNTMMGYLGHLLADAAHHKRSVILKNNNMFPLSGYIMAIKNIGFILPENCLADDAYISYFLFNNGYKLKYQPEARSFVKYPKTLSDYFKQKQRSLGGYVQLFEYGVVRKETISRSFFQELQYFWFPLKYATNFKELYWSLLFYPIRFITWLKIWWDRKILNKSFKSTWVRIESTK